MFTESKIIKQITILPQTNSVNVQWANQVLKGTDVISETLERKAYDATLSGFNTEVGSLDVNAFLAAFNAATLDDKAAAVAAKATAEAALAQALADKAAAVSAATTTLNAQITALQAQVQALTPAPVTDPMIDDLQIRLALNRTGLRAAVEAAVDAGDQDLKDWWLKARRFFRSNPMVVAMGETVGVTPEQLDDLWALGATL